MRTHLAVRFSTPEIKNKTRSLRSKGFLECGRGVIVKLPALVREGLQNPSSLSTLKKRRAGESLRPDTVTSFSGTVARLRSQSGGGSGPTTHGLHQVRYVKFSLRNADRLGGHVVFAEVSGSQSSCSYIPGNRLLFWTELEPS